MFKPTSPRVQRRALCGMALAVLACSSSLVLATDYRWDAGQTPATPAGGSGAWDLTSPLWSNGATDIVWPNTGTDGAIFGGTAGLVSVTDPLVTAGSLAFTTAGYTVNLGGTTQTLGAAATAGTVTSGGLAASYATGTTTVTAGAIAITADANFLFGPGTTSGSTNTLDLSGLTSFSFAKASRAFTVQPSTSAGATNAVMKMSLVSNSITASAIQVGGASGSSAGTVLNSTLGLGAGNAFNADALTVGGFNGRGTVSPQAGVASPSLTVRGSAGGTTAVALGIVGLTSSGSRDGSGTLDLSGGTLDARLGTLVIGQHIAGANAPTNISSTVNMGAGSVVASEIVVVNKQNTGGPVLVGTFAQAGGTVAATTLTLGRAGPLAGPIGTAAGDGAATYNANYNLSGGTLSVGAIQMVGIPGLTAVPTISAASKRAVNFSGGTITTLNASSDLLIDGVTGTLSTRPNGIVQVIASAGGTKTFDVPANRKIIFGANSSLTGAGQTVVKTGAGSLILNQAIPAFAPSGYGALNVVTTDLSVLGGTVGGTATSSGSILTGPNTTLAPGNSIGTITFGSATLGGDLLMEYSDAGGTTSDGLIDKLIVTGALDIAASSVTFSDILPGSTPNDTAYIFASYGTLAGTFTAANNVPAGYTVNYAYLGNNIALVPVPEPTVALLGLAVLPLARRRRR